MPQSSPPLQQLIRFGVFELDLRAGELRKQGVKVKLQEQPLKLLQFLLENPGQIVSREELRTHIWPADTFVEFDHGLYSAIARLRDALGDSSESPRFIETVARRGYRFIAPVTSANPLPETQVGEVADQIPRVSSGLDFRRLITTVVASLVGGALLLTIVFAFDFAGIKEWLRGRTPKTVQVQRITDFVGVKESPAISPDVKTVAFVAPVNGHKQIWIRLLAGGEPCNSPRMTPIMSIPAGLPILVP